MERVLRTLAAILACLAVCMWPGDSARSVCSEPIPGVALVRFASGETSLPGSQTLAPIEDVTFATSAVEDSLVEWRVTDLELLAPLWSGLSQGALEAGLVDFSQVYMVSVPDTTDIDSLVTKLGTLGEVRAAQPMYAATTFAIDDPDYPQQWHLENTEQDPLALPDVDLDAESAWETTLGDPSVIIHVLDTGVEHSDITESLPASHDCHPASFQFHGTNVAGIVAANPNSSHTRGVAPNTQIGDIRLDPDSEGALSCGLMNAANRGARVANMSVGTLSDEFEVLSGSRNLYLSGVHGCLIVAAAGNGITTEPCPVYPAAYDHLALGVGAVTNGGRYWGEGMYVPDGGVIDVSAPGGSSNIVTTTYPNNGTNHSFGGTSAATPMVSGIAALLLAEDNTLYNDDLSNVITRSALDISPPGDDIHSGAGLVNARRALDFIGSPRVIERGAIAKADVAVVETSALYLKRFKNLGWVFNDETLPDEDTAYWVRRLTLEGGASFGPPYLQDISDVWVRHKDGFVPGWPDEFRTDCLKFVGWGMVDTTAWDSTSVTLKTYTYAVHEIGDTSFVRYVPVHPDSVEIPYTAVLGEMEEWPYVEVHKPNGGEHWLAGNRNITWEATDDDGIDSVSIYWSLDDGVEWPQTLATGVTADTTWLWALAGEDTTGSSKSRIAIVAYDGDGDLRYDMSDTTFAAITAQNGGVPQANRGPESAPLPPNAWVEGRFIYLYVPSASRAELVIYDVQGRRVTTLVDRPLARGLHRVVWDKSNASGQPVASGMYFYRFKSGGFRRTGKIVVVR